MADFDLSGFLKESSIPDLDWLDVDEVAYRQQDRLPKQNLDVRPDLEALWAHADEPATAYLVPNHTPVTASPGGVAPRTMGDLSERHGPLRETAEDLRRTMRLAMMRSDDLGRLRNELVGRFGMQPLQEHRRVVASVLKERGLLGRLYIDSADFPACAKSGKPAEFVARYASTAKFVLAKTACGGCCHASKTPTGSHVCGQFQKEIKIDVPVTPALADEIEAQQVARGRAVLASGGEPLDRIRLAYLAAPATKHDPKYTGTGVDQRPKSTLTPQQAATQLVAASSLVRKKGSIDKTAMDAKPVLAFLHSEMVRGPSREELVGSLRQAFDRDLLARTQQHWAPLFQENGLYGVVYTKQASFEDCHKGADFLATHNPGVRAIVAGSKCGSCVYNKSRCLLYGKPLVKNASDVLTTETVEAVLLEHRTAGRLQPWDSRVASGWGATPAEALKRIHAAAKVANVPTAGARLDHQQGFYGGPKRELQLEKQLGPIAKQAQRYLNEGLYGQELEGLLRSKYASVDLLAAKDELRTVLAEQGLQGVHYVDPTVYDDYGKGCDEAARLHGTRMVPYLKLGSSCSGCVHQVKRGFCSKVRKALVQEPPYTDKRAQQRAVLASGRPDVVDFASLVNNGTSMLSEFNMQHEMQVDVDAMLKPRDVSIMFGTGKVKL